MVIRRISVRLYLAAAAVVVVIIATGWVLAGLVNLGRANELERRWSRQQGNWNHVQRLHSEVQRRASTETCGETRSALLNSADHMGAIRRKLDSYLTSPFGDSNARILDLKREHVKVTLAHWEMATTLREACGSALPPVLYLYSGKRCSRCFLQKKILLFMERSHHPELLTFPVDVDFEPPEQVSRLLGIYAVNSLPASIIAATKYEGFLSRKDLRKILLPHVEAARGAVFDEVQF
jgi:hypothetical protein